jgi:arylsulfatase A-like enzyme
MRSQTNFLSRPLPEQRLTRAALVSLVGALLIANDEHQARGETIAEKKPNIVLIVADDLGYGDLGFQGGKEIPTPHLDSLAAGGVRLTDGYVSCPVCSPTRAGLATGRYQQRFGHEFNPGQAQSKEGAVTGLPLSETTLASALKQAGYTTANVGKWHLGSADGYRPLQRGFDEFYGFLGGAHPYIPGGAGGQAAKQGRGKKQNAGGGLQPIFRGEEQVDFPPHLTKAFGDEAAAFIKREKDKPYFLYLTFNAVHNPLQPDPEHVARFDNNISDPKRKAYAGLLSGLDDAVGTVLKAIRDSGQEENTLVFFISDNGGPQQGNGSNNQPLTGDKGTVKEGGIRVPFVVQWKGKLPAGTKYSHPAISLDITATAAAAGGAKLGGEGRKVDGVNLLPHLLGENKSAPHDSLYWRFGPQQAIRQGNFKLVKMDGQEPRLYDVVADVAESKDLASAHPEILTKLDKAYGEWDAELAEPLWKRGPRQGRRNRANQRATLEKQAEAQTEAALN